jgi:hypothetical protein
VGYVVLSLWDSGQHKITPPDKTFGPNYFRTTAIIAGGTPVATSACAASALGYDGFSFSLMHETDGGEFFLGDKIHSS